MVLLSLLDTLETRTWNWLGRVIWAHLTSEHLMGKSLRAKGLPTQVNLKVALTMNWCVFSIIADHIKTTALIIHKFSQNPNIDKTMCFTAEKLLLNLPKLIRIFAYDCFGNIIASAAGWAHLIQRQSWLETPKQLILWFSLPACVPFELPSQRDSLWCSRKYLSPLYKVSFVWGGKESKETWENCPAAAEVPCKAFQGGAWVAVVELKSRRLFRWKRGFSFNSGSRHGTNEK